MITGGTDNHLLLVDVSSLGITGDDAQTALDEVGITLNKNSIPDDPRGPMDPSGIRFGTPAITTRGFGADECRIVANAMIDVMQDIDNADLRKETKENITNLCLAHPVPNSFI